MARDNVFICDKCGTKWEGAENIRKDAWPVMVELRLGFCGYSPSPAKSQEWCRGCAISAGIIMPQKGNLEETKKAPNPTPTTEDLLVELIESLGFTRGN